MGEGAAGGDSAQLRLRLIDAATGTVIRQLPTVTIARTPSANVAHHSVEPLASAVGFVTNPLLGAVTLPSGPLPGLGAFRDFESGLERFGFGGTDTANVRRSIESLRQAVAADSSFAQARLWLGITYGWSASFARGEGGAVRADTVRRWVEAARGHPAEGRALEQKAVDWFAMHESDVQASANVATRSAIALMEVGRDDDAAAVPRRQIGRDSSDSRLLGLLGRIYARQGKKAETQAILTWLEALPAVKLQGAPTYERAAITVNMGPVHWDEAIALLNESLRQGQGNGIRRRLHWFADWRPLKDYPPFQQVLEPKG